MNTGLPDYLTQAAQGAQTAQQSASQLGAYAGSIPDALKKAVQNAYKDNQDVLTQLDTATADYLQSPSEARVKFQNIWNPFQRESLVSQYTSNQAIPMLSYSGIYGQRMGRAGDLINAGVGAYQADIAAQQAVADAAQQAYENALQQYQLEEDRRRWEAEQAGQGSALQAILDLINKQNEQLKIPEVPSSVGVTSFIKDEDTNFPINTYPNPTNTGNITAYTAPTQSIYNVGSTTSPFTNVGGIDLGSAPQAPQVKPSLWSRIRSLLGWRE
jgi:hypothetical protein